MSGVHSGLAVRMKAVSPLAIYLHCMGHQLNLTVKDTVTTVKILSEALGTVQSLYTFIEASPKRHAIYMECDVNNNDTGFIRTLKSLSITRWTCRYDAVRAVDEELPRIVICLDKIQNDKSSDAKTSSEAMSLLINIMDEKFLFAIEVLKIILVHTSKLSSYLQSTKTCLLYTSPSPRDLSTSRMPSSA